MVALKSIRPVLLVWGLRRIGHTVEVEDTPSVRGMINKVNYLVTRRGARPMADDMRLNSLSPRRVPSVQQSAWVVALVRASEKPRVAATRV